MNIKGVVSIDCNEDEWILEVGYTLNISKITLPRDCNIKVVVDPYNELCVIVENPPDPQKEWPGKSSMGVSFTPKPGHLSL